MRDCITLKADKPHPALHGCSRCGAAGAGHADVPAGSSGVECRDCTSAHEASGWAKRDGSAASKTSNFVPGSSGRCTAWLVWISSRTLGRALSAGARSRRRRTGPGAGNIVHRFHARACVRARRPTRSTTPCSRFRQRLSFRRPSEWRSGRFCTGKISNRMFRLGFFALLLLGMQLLLKSPCRARRIASGANC